jgi:N-acetylglucosamine kinase-like BadF-type ATPase
VVRESDGRGPRTRLTPLVLEHFKLTRVDGLVRAVYDQGLNRQSIAALGPLVAKARELGDIAAAEILDKAAEELTRATSSVITRLGMRGDAFGIVLSGGMFKVIPWLVEELTRRLGDVAPRATVAALTVEPALGAVRLAVRELHEGVVLPPYVEDVTT